MHYHRNLTNSHWNLFASRKDETRMFKTFKILKKNHASHWSPCVPPKCCSSIIPVLGTSFNAGIVDYSNPVFPSSFLLIPHLCMSTKDLTQWEVQGSFVGTFWLVVHWLLNVPKESCTLVPGKAYRSQMWLPLCHSVKFHHPSWSRAGLIPGKSITEAGTCLPAAKLA